MFIAAVLVSLLIISLPILAMGFALLLAGEW